jgi:Tat protein secretion system quality control protein TatD with DNase activity
MQESFFRAQLALAIEFQRPISVHCVQATGPMLELFAQLSRGAVTLDSLTGAIVKTESSSEVTAEPGIDSITAEQSSASRGHKDELPPAIIMHSFTGSAETVRQLTRPSRASMLPKHQQKVFFSFSHAVHTRLASRLANVVRAIPDNKILLESDLEVLQVSEYHNLIGTIDEEEYHDAMMWVTKAIAEAKEWSVGETLERCRDNFFSFLKMVGID